jgi:hypothetical protein
MRGSGYGEEPGSVPHFAFSQLVTDRCDRSLNGTVLFFEPVPPASARLLWPTNDPDPRLQFTTDRVSASPLALVAGTNNVVTNALTGTRKLYRIIKP